MNKNVKRGEIYYAELSPVVGSEQGGIRPVLILQNDTGNKHSPTTIGDRTEAQLPASPNTIGQGLMAKLHYTIHPLQ